MTCQRDGEPVEDIYPCHVPGTGTTEFQNVYFTQVTLNDTVRVDIRQTTSREAANKMPTRD